MFHVMIKNDKDVRILLSKDISAPAANYFAYCVEYLIDLLNGAPQISRILERHGQTNSLGTIDAPKIAIYEFLSCLHKHPHLPTKLYLKMIIVTTIYFKNFCFTARSGCG